MATADGGDPSRPRHAAARYRVVWEEPPGDPEATLQLLSLSPRWLAARLAEGLTEEEATEREAARRVPAEVRARRGNRRVLAIVPVEAIPTDRRWRDAWRLRQDMETAAGDDGMPSSWHPHQDMRGEP